MSARVDMNLKFAKPEAGDCRVLSEFVFRSKASHGYNEVFMDACRDELLVTPQTLNKGPSQIAWTVLRSEPVGFVQIVQTTPVACELGALFIAPKNQGLGVGRVLLEWAVEAAITMGFQEMFINSDPDAEKFYTTLGALRIGETPSGSIKGRSLPRLSYSLSK